MASKRLGALPKITRGAPGRGCGREGSGALPLPRAAAVSTGLSVRHVLQRAARRRRRKAGVAGDGEPSQAGHRVQPLG